MSLALPAHGTAHAPQLALLSTAPPTRHRTRTFGLFLSLPPRRGGRDAAAAPAAAVEPRLLVVAAQVECESKR